MTRFLTPCLILMFSVSATAVRAEDQSDSIRVNAMVVTEPATDRPAALMPMYIGLSALQAFDGYSTYAGIRNGASEQNPIVASTLNQPIAFWTMKAVSTTTTIYFAEQLWRRHHKTQAIMLMVAANATMGVIAARNASFLRAR